MKQSILGLGVALLSVLVGCSDAGRNHDSPTDGDAGEGPSRPPKGGGEGGNGPGPGEKPDAGGAGEGAAGPDVPDVGQLSVLMRRATSCDDLATRARARIHDRLAEQIAANLTPSQGGGSGSAGMWGGGGAPTVGGAGGASSGGSGTTGGGPSGEASGPEFTDTNTQVRNIDEPDFVKTDGTNLYIVQRGKLRVARAFPAAELAEITSMPIAGQGAELFLTSGANAGEKLLVVYSTLAAQELGDDVDEQQPWAPWVKVTVAKLANDELSTIAEYAFEGSYLSARREGDQVRQVLNVAGVLPSALRAWPTDADRRKAELVVLERLADEGRRVSDLSSDELEALFKEELVNVLNDENDALLAKLQGEDFLPRAFTIAGGELSPTNMACDRVFIPTAGEDDGSITYVPELDLAHLDQAPTGAALLGRSDTIYQNADHFVATSAASDAAGTYVHAFKISGDEPLDYVASGSVDGTVANSFSLDERGGDFHVVSSVWDQTRATKLFTLQADGTDLSVVGETEEIAPGESLRSVRFVGDTAYIVTFRNVDPLFVFDLSDPEQPTQLAELTIPGFSQYMHPVDDHTLLTIGSSDAWSSSVVLRLFDVTDKTAPELRFSHQFAPYSSSAAQYDHHAFTYFADRGLLAVPLSGYTYDTEEHWINQLSLIGVSRETGFSELGAIDGVSLETALTGSGTCSWYARTEAQIERGTFIDDTLYAIARGGVVAAKVATPSTTIETLPLPTGDCGAGGTGGMTGTGGVAGSAGTGWGGSAAGSQTGGSSTGGAGGTAMGGTGGS